MRLLAELSHLARQPHILALAEHSAKCVAGKRFRSRLVPGHDDASVHAASQCHANTLVTVKVSGQVARKHLPQFTVERLGLQEVLLLPLPRQEIRCLSIDQAVPEIPRRSAREDVDVLENRAIFKHTTARDKL